VTGNELLIVKPSPILGAPGVCNVGVPCTLAVSVFGFVGGSYKCVGALLLRLPHIAAPPAAVSQKQLVGVVS
jgi:hypothetical protein